MLGNSIGLIGRSRDTAALHRELVSILGSNLIALYIPEDIIYDVSGNATGWKARIGTDLTVTNSGSGRLKNNKTLLNGKDGIYPTDYNTSLNYFSGNSSNYKYALAVANIITLPFAQYETIIRSNSPATAVIESNGGQSYLRYNAAWLHFIDGVQTDTCTAGTHIIEATNSTSHSGFKLAGNADGPYQWRDGVGLIFACTTVPTELQRRQIYEIVGKYYAITKGMETNTLAKNLLTIYGSNLVDVWIGDDINIGTDGYVREWSGRISNLTRYELGSYDYRKAKTYSNGRVGCYTPDTTTSIRALGSSSSSTVFKSLWTVAEIPTTYFADMHQCVCAYADSHVIACASGSQNLYSGIFTHYINGTSGESLAGLSGNIAIIEADKSDSTYSGMRIGGGGSNYPSRNWAPPIFFSMSLANIATADQRQWTLNLLRQYYRL